jgi:hypothetical protein
MVHKDRVKTQKDLINSAPENTVYSTNKNKVSKNSKDSYRDLNPANKLKLKRAIIRELLAFGEAPRTCICSALEKSNGDISGACKELMNRKIIEYNKNVKIKGCGNRARSIHPIRLTESSLRILEPYWNGEELQPCDFDHLFIKPQRIAITPRMAVVASEVLTYAANTGVIPIDSVDKLIESFIESKRA